LATAAEGNDTVVATLSDGITVLDPSGQLVARSEPARL
jgi:hypothetical protein